MQIVAYLFPILYHYTAPQFGQDTRNALEVRNQGLIRWCFKCPARNRPQLLTDGQTAENVCTWGVGK